jgi:hypothetical protein
VVGPPTRSRYSQPPMNVPGLVFDAMNASEESGTRSRLTEEETWSQYSPLRPIMPMDAPSPVLSFYAHAPANARHSALTCIEQYDQHRQVPPDYTSLLPRLGEQSGFDLDALLSLGNMLENGFF